MTPTDQKQPTPEPVSDLVLIDAVVTSLDDALATIDRAELGARTPGEQLATLAVGIVRGLAAGSTSTFTVAVPAGGVTAPAAVASTSILPIPDRTVRTA